jgi:hypothetical protein
MKKAHPPVYIFTGGYPIAASGFLIFSFLQRKQIAPHSLVFKSAMPAIQR